MLSLRRDDAALLYVLHSGNLYGTERMALATLHGLSEYEVRALIAPAPSEPDAVGAADVARNCGYQTRLVVTKLDLVRHLAGYFVRFGKVDLIGNGVTQSRLCHGLARLLGTRLRQIHIVHGGIDEERAYGRQRRLNHLPLRVVAVSDFVRSKLVELGTRGESIDVIDNFLSDEQRAHAPRRLPYERLLAAGADASPTRVAIVSRVDPIKRVDLLVDAIERGGLEAFDFAVYGTGTELARLRDRAAGIANIRFHGYVSDVGDRLARSDLLLHLCPQEPFGLAILEGFAAGVATIVPAAGGAGALIDDGINGFRFAADDPDDLRRTLLRARASAPDRLQSLVAEAARRLESRFSERAGAIRYRACFDRLGP